MQELDADDERLVDEFGKKQDMDTVQFVEFSKFGNSAQLLTREVLDEVPRQVQTFYSKKNIMPYDSNPLYRNNPNPGYQSMQPNMKIRQVFLTNIDFS